MTKKTNSSGRSASRISPLVLIGGVVVVLVIVGIAAFLRGNVPGSPLALASPPPPSAPPSTSAAPAPTSPSDQPVTGLPRANVERGAWYTVYFTVPAYPEKKQDRSGGIDQAIVADMDRALKTIDAAVFDLRLPSLVEALVRAQQRGVRVRVIVDYEANKDAKEFTDAVKKVKDAGIEVVENHRSALMHDKFAVIDNRVLWTGSMNFTPNDAYRNNNNMLRLENPALIQNYSQIFERIFLSRAAQAPSKTVPNPRIELDNGVVIENYFSPNGGAQQAILKRLNAAQSDIRITAYTFTDTAMAQVLKEKYKEHVLVQGVFEKRNNDGLGAEYADLKRAGLDVLEDGNCYILHSKLMIIDGKTVVMGSYNYTDAANKTNDENLLIIDDPVLAKEYTQEFDRIYAQAKNPTKCASGS